MHHQVVRNCKDLMYNSLFYWSLFLINENNISNIYPPTKYLFFILHSNKNLNGIFYIGLCLLCYIYTLSNDLLILTMKWLFVSHFGAHFTVLSKLQREHKQFTVLYSKQVVKCCLLLLYFMDGWYKHNMKRNFAQFSNFEALK